MSDNFGNIGDMLTEEEQNRQEHAGRHEEETNRHGRSGHRTENAPGHSFGNIGDIFPSKEIKCRIHGCNNKVILSGREAMNVAAGAAKAERMCDECYAKLKTLEDKEMPCSKPGCTGTWIWNRYQQLEATAGGRNITPHGLCKKCQEEMKQVQDIQRPCRIKGCKNTWTYTAREQLLKGSATIPSRMCDDCYKLLNTLEDKVIKCRIKGCEHTITWNRYQQLEYIRSGKSPESTPSRMCDSCYEIYKTLKPIEVPCRIKGCKNTWIFSPNDQLEEILAGHLQKTVVPEATSQDGPASEAPVETPEAAPAENTQAAPVAAIPNRMCPECYDFFKNAVDMEMPCKNHNCKNTWTFTKSMQLTQKHFHKDHTPVHYCEECSAKLKTLENKEMPCSQEGCNKTWTYTKEEQLRDLSAGKTPRNRRCKDCTDFIATHPTLKIQCEKCGEALMITSQQQLEHERGISALPTLCGKCATQDLENYLNNKNNQETK